jgi:hypothetical protein
MNLKLMCGLAVACAFAVGASASETKGGETKGGMKTLTGCLKTGTEAGTYMLTNVSGGPEATNKEWELIGAPAALKLSEHVGHKVAISGHVVGVGAATKVEQKTTTTASDAKVETTKEMKTESGERHLEVKSMKHIAATCP